MKRLLFALVAALSLPSFSLLAAVSADQHWDNQFGPAGLNASPYALVAVTSNTVYAGGSFTTAIGNTRANGVAGFNGTNWYQLESGLMSTPPDVLGLNTDGNNLYVGGIFTNADDATINEAARWDGTSWSNIGIHGLLLAVKRNSNNLYFVGDFTAAGSVNATNITRWDGTNYYALGTSVSGSGFSSLPSIDCLAFQGNNVYVGGNFSQAGGSTATNIAYWDGSSWHAMGNPFNGTVDALQVFNGTLYAGGVFTNSSLQITNIALWNGSAWSNLPGGGAMGGIGVYDMATNATSLFLSGAYTHIGGIAATSIVSFDGNNWTSMGSFLLFQGAPGSCYKLAFQSNQLYAAGAFERAGNAGACCVARWDGANWNTVGQTSKGVPPTSVNFVESLLQVNSSTALPSGLYMGGLFSDVGSTAANCIARWDGTNWNALGGGVSGNFSGGNGQRINAMATDGTNLYGGGIFTNVSGTYMSGVAYWNGSTWNPMGSGVDFIVSALAIGQANNVWVGGSFTNAGGFSSPGLAVWYSGAWHNQGTVQGTSPSVTALVYDGSSKVYIGGSFNTVGGVNATNIAYYDYNTSSMHALGVGLQAGKVSALLYTNGILYAGGTFTNSSTTTLWRIAQWNGSTWSALGNGIAGNGAAAINGIVPSGGNIYVTGNFTNASGVVATNVAYWDGSAWHAMGSGLDNSRVGSAITANGNDIYVGGSFQWAGDKPSVFIAHWNAQSNYYPTANVVLTRTVVQTNRMFKFRVTGTSGQDYVIQSSTNLMNSAGWSSLQTNSAMYYDFADTNAPAPYRFYRTILGP